MTGIGINILSVHFLRLTYFEGNSNKNTNMQMTQEKKEITGRHAIEKYNLHFLRLTYYEDYINKNTTLEMTQEKGKT